MIGLQSMRCFQELAVIVAEQGSQLQNINNIQGWLYRVAVRQSLLYRRRKRRHHKLKKGYTEYQTSFGQQQVDPLQWLLAEETRQLVRTAMKKLTSKENEILMLKYSEEWSYQQLAVYLGINARAVASRLNRARNRLRQELHYLNVNEVIS